MINFTEVVSVGLLSANSDDEWFRYTAILTSVFAIISFIISPIICIFVWNRWGTRIKKWCRKQCCKLDPGGGGGDAFELNDGERKVTDNSDIHLKLL